MGGNVSAPIKRLGSWLKQDRNWIYQAETDGFVTVCTTAQMSNFEILTDDATPPMKIRAKSRDDDGNAWCSATVPVKKHDYWEVTGATVDVIYWIPLEP